MKKTLLAFLLLAAIALPGCGDLVLGAKRAEQAAATMPAAGAAVDKGATALEDMIDRPLVEPETAKKVAEISGTLASISEKLETLAQAANDSGMIPEDKKPIGELTESGLSLLTALSLAVTAFMAKRASTAKKEAKATTAAAVQLAETVPGGGAALSAIAPRHGIAESVASEYVRQVEAGLAAKKTPSSSPLATSPTA